MSRLRIASIVLVGACGSKDPPPAPTTGSSSGAPPSGEFMDAPKQDFATDQRRVPDEPGWRQAVFVAVNAWTASFNKLGVTDVEVRPLETPDGKSTKYLLRVTATKSGERVFEGTALISKGTMLNGGGLSKLEAHFKALGFPMTTRLAIGHLITEFSLTRGIDAAWLRLPDTVGWDYTRPQGLASHAPATLVYDDDGALLTLFRDGKAGGGSGSGTPALERLEVRIDLDGLVTQKAARQVGATWEPFTP